MIAFRCPVIYNNVLPWLNRRSPIGHPKLQDCLQLGMTPDFQRLSRTENMICCASVHQSGAASLCLQGYSSRVCRTITIPNISSQNRALQCGNIYSLVYGQTVEEFFAHALEVEETVGAASVSRRLEGRKNLVESIMIVTAISTCVELAILLIGI